MEPWTLRIISSMAVHGVSMFLHCVKKQLQSTSLWHSVAEKNCLEGSNSDQVSWCKMGKFTSFTHFKQSTLFSRVPQMISAEQGLIAGDAQRPEWKKSQFVRLDIFTWMSKKFMLRYQHQINNKYKSWLSLVFAKYSDWRMWIFWSKCAFYGNVV